jgi:tetratricopeptide (TPR) repeat protein
MDFRRFVFALIACATVAAGAPACAAPGPAGAIEGQDKRNAADETVVRSVFQDFGAGGFPALQRLLPKLRKVLDRAPTRYPRIEVRGEIAIVRANEGDEATPALTLGALLQAANAGQPRRVVVEYNTYPMASFLLGSFANEARQPRQAIEFLDRGLALQPENAWLVSEKGAALVQLQRPSDALALYETWFKDALPEADDTHARLLRAKGFALVELDRLDEAEAAYRKSLELEPGHGLAQRELAYIASLRGGAARQAVEITTGDKAREIGTEDQPKP